MTIAHHGPSRVKRLALAAVGMAALAALTPSPASAGSGAPEFFGATPADNAVIEVKTLTGFVSQAVQVKDPDQGDIVTLTVDGLPPDARLENLSNPGIEVFSVINWTPSAPGDYPITLVATDQDQNVTERNITVRVTEPTTAEICVPGEGHVEFASISWNGKPLVQPRKKSTGRVRFDVTGGFLYSVRLVSTDPRHAPGAYPDQTEEQWVVRLFRNNKLIYTSDPISDLAESNTIAEEFVGEVFLPAGGIYKAQAVHVGSASSPNSIVPSCVLIGRGRQ